MEGYRQGGGLEENGEKHTENKKHNWQVQNRQGEVKNCLENGEAKELICMTNGHELRGGMLKGKGVQGGGGKRGEKWDNCNNIINKIHFKSYSHKFTSREQQKGFPLPVPSSVRDPTFGGRTRQWDTLHVQYLAERRSVTCLRSHSVVTKMIHLSHLCGLHSLQGTVLFGLCETLGMLLFLTVFLLHLRLCLFLLLLLLLLLLKKNQKQKQ